MRAPGGFLRWMAKELRRRPAGGRELLFMIFADAIDGSPYSRRKQIAKDFRSHVTSEVFTRHNERELKHAIAVVLMMGGRPFHSEDLIKPLDQESPIRVLMVASKCSEALAREAIRRAAE